MEPFPDTKRISLRDVVKRVDQVHSCIDEGRAETRTLDGKVDGLADRVSSLSENVARMSGVTETMARGFGFPTVPHPEGAEPKVRVPQTRISWKTIIAVASCATGLQFLYKVAVDVWPALHHALLTVH